MTDQLRRGDKKKKNKHKTFISFFDAFQFFKGFSTNARFGRDMVR